MLKQSVKVNTPCHSVAEDSAEHKLCLIFNACTFFAFLYIVVQVWTQM